MQVKSDLLGWEGSKKRLNASRSFVFSDFFRQFIDLAFAIVLDAHGIKEADQHRALGLQKPDLQNLLHYRSIHLHAQLSQQPLRLLGS